MTSEETSEIGQTSGENSYPSPASEQPLPPPPEGIDRFYYVADSPPLFTAGECSACKRQVNFASGPFDDNLALKCGFCGALTPRLDAIRGLLASMNMIAWSLFSSDKYIWDRFTIKPGQIISYKGIFESAVPAVFEKWLRHDAWVDAPDGRYVGNPIFLDAIDPPASYFLLRDQWPTVSAPEPLPDIGFSWFRYGLSSVGAVPAWRQALFGAVTLVDNNPPAAVVLISAGFEAFFVESMRIAWKERGLDESAFRKLDRNPLASLVEWLPSAVQRPNLVEAPRDLHSRWSRLVNQRRNDVMHRADIQVTSEQAWESLGVALEAITFLDAFALTRPHAYFVGR